MLSRLRSFTLYHVHAATQSFNALCGKPWASLMTILVIAITLTLPAILWILNNNLQQLTHDWQKTGHISVYLKTNVALSEAEEFLKKIRADKAVGQATLKTPAEGLQELQQQDGLQDIMHYLSENPLPAVIEITPLSLNQQQIKQFYEQLSHLPEVDQVKLDIEWINRLHSMFGFSNKLTHALMLILLLGIILIVGNTLRSAIHVRQEEIRVLKLVGATDAYITRPFLYTGIWYGLLGAVLTVLFVTLFMVNVNNAAQEFMAAYPMYYPISGLSVRQAYTIVILAIFLGWLGAILAVKRQLATIEPYQ